MATQVEHTKAGAIEGGSFPKNVSNVPEVEALRPGMNEKQTSTTNKGVRTPKMSIKSTKSFDQQVKLMIEESMRHGTKALLGKLLLQDQAMRMNSIQPQSSKEPSVSASMSRIVNPAVSPRAKSPERETPQALEPSPSSRPRYTASGRKLHDTSIQAVIVEDEVGSSANLTLAASRIGASRRSVRPQHSRPSVTPAGRGKLMDGSKASVVVSKRTILNSAPSLLRSVAGSGTKLQDGSKSKVVPKHALSSNVGSAKIPTSSPVGSKVTQETAAASKKSVPEKPEQISFRPKLLADGSMRTFAGSRVVSDSTINASGSKPTSEIPQESHSLTDSRTMLVGSKRIPKEGVKSEESSKQISISESPPTQEFMNPSQNFQSGTNQSKSDSSFREESFASLQKKSSKEPPHKIHLKTHLKGKFHHPNPGEMIQAISGHPAQPYPQFRSSHTVSTKSTGPKLSLKPGPRNSTQKSSLQTGITTSKEDRNQMHDSKVIQPTESQLKKMLMYCDCSDIEVLGENEMPEMKFDFHSFKKSTESSKNVSFTRPKIKSVARSPFERKDRAARAAFAKELEQMEIAEIEKKQKLKPRKIKKELKKEGVYETIKKICHIPDSFADSLRGNPSCPSMLTGASLRGASHSSLSESQRSRSPSSSVMEDKIQLRKDNSLGSRVTGAGLTREDAFHEIELSEESEGPPTSIASCSSSSSCEIISSSSEISMRVNLEKTYSPEERRKKRAKNAPFRNYQNKINAELVLAEGVKARSKILDSNLEGVIIEKIATEFGEWAKENGVKPEAVEKDVIKELFQFGTMDTAANSIAVEIKELILVPECITDGMYPELEERAAMYRQILFDEGAYWRTERSMAFGKPDPKPYKRPPHAPLPTWTKSGFVPQPLATGELLYQTLIDNESLMLERYVVWMVDNPKHYRPPYLLKSGYFQKIIDKHGGSEEAIRHTTAIAKSMLFQTGKSMAGLNVGMQSDLKKLKEMSEAGKKHHAQG